MSSASGVSVDEITELLRGAGLSPYERIVMPSKPAVHAPVPAGLHAKLSQALSGLFPSGIYSHQASAIEAVIAGHDVCLATPTASGKSLVFMTAAAQVTLNHRFERVLALYPAKALIQDQLEKWSTFLDPFGIRVGFIDGSVPAKGREKILDSCRVVAMTPDVAHAWLMSHLATKEVRGFRMAVHMNWR
jgi:DEAD/DEAH box helicase domain-containing protein